MYIYTYTDMYMYRLMCLLSHLVSLLFIYVFMGFMYSFNLQFYTHIHVCTDTHMCILQFCGAASEAVAGGTPKGIRGGRVAV